MSTRASRSRSLSRSRSRSRSLSRSRSRSARKSKSLSQSAESSMDFSKVKANCSAEKLLAFSKRHYTYINQIFGDATVRQIIEEEYPTTWQFKVAKAGPEFGNSFHHTVRDREQPELVVCSGVDGVQDLNKNVNDTLCQSYSLLNYFEIPIQLSEEKGKLKQIYHETNQKAMAQMYRDILNGTLENYEDVDFTFKTKSPGEYKNPFINDVMYANYRGIIWKDEYELVFIKGNRINVTIK